MLVRGQSNRLLDDQGSLLGGLVLMRFSLDMTQAGTGISDATQSLVVDKEGQIIAHSEKNIGYRVGFFGDPNEAQNSSNRGYRVGNEDEVFGGVPYTAVSVNPWVYPGGIDVSDNDGKYSFSINSSIISANDLLSLIANCSRFKFCSSF